jgi:signal transduction histidine kinase
VAITATPTTKISTADIAAAGSWGDRPGQIHGLVQLGSRSSCGLMRRLLARSSVVDMSVRVWARRWGDGIVAFALAVGAELEFWGRAPSGMTVTGGRVPLAILLGVAIVPLAWRRRAPALVVLTIVGALAVASVLVSHWHGVPVEVFFAVMLAFYSVGAHCAERPALIVGGVALTTVAAIDLARPEFFNGTGSPRPAAWLVLAVAWLVGREMRRRRRELAMLRDRARQLEREREEKARAAVADERGRIARELHDVVAHSVSVMVVQAQAGQRLLSNPELAGGAVRAIEASGREALVELRRLLGILRTADDHLVIGPQPGLGSLDVLLEQVRKAGLPVELRVEGERVQPPTGVDLAAYRIVQEALTNTLKHAGSAKAEIILRYGPAAIELEVLDDGDGAAAAANGSGHGLIGMRERAALYGGRLEAEPRKAGGFAVRARLPFEGGPR